MARTNGTMTTKARSISTQAGYAGEGLTIDLSYNEDAITSTLKSLDGTIYKSATGTAEDRTYAGNFSGQLKGEEIEYSMNGVKSGDMAAVIAAINDIEGQIRAAEEPVNPANE